MNIDDMEYFVAVAQHRNMGRAAAALGLTQPALTRAVARLEVLAGQRLFTRHPKGVEPTPAGSAFLRRALRICREHQDALGELRQLRSGHLGVLRVAYSPSVDEQLLGGALRQLLQERPAARLQLTQRLMQELFEPLAAGEFDLLVGPVPAVTMAGPPLDAVTLYESHMNIIADSEHPLILRGRPTLTDVAAEAWLLPAAHTALRQELEAAMAAAGLPPLNVRVEANIVDHGQFVILCNSRVLGLCSDWWLPTVRRLGLQRVDLDPPLAQRRIAVLRRADAPPLPLADRLTELLQAWAPRSPG